MPDDGVKLRIDYVTLKLGGVQSLSRVNFNIKEKETLSIIGPNGAAKNCIIE
jgi:ABC-type branched-subunit amino acid transport system ATPase component